VSTLDSKTRLTIVDLARPIMVAKRYYEDIVKIETDQDTNKNWATIQAKEIEAFKGMLIKLQRRGYGALVNKLDFIERG